MSSLERLLELQAVDTSIDQLQHRHRTLPARAQLDGLVAERKAAAESVVDERARREELARAQKRLEDEIAGVEAKAANVDRQLYGGGITSPKEAQALQADLESLRRRQSDLEDQVLELMEEAEPLDAELAEVDTALTTLDARHDQVQAELADAEAAVDAELDAARAARQALAADIPPDLLAAYERLRATSDGVAVARLKGATCEGCHLTLAPAVVDELRRQPADALVHCPECQRLLVR